MLKQSKDVALVFLGGALGSGLRFSLGLLLPAGTPLLFVNVLGTFLLGLVNGREWKPWVHPFWGTGVAGGFTTLSGVALFMTGKEFAPLPVLLMLALGFVAHWLGMRLVKNA